MIRRSYQNGKQYGSTWATSLGIAQTLLGSPHIIIVGDPTASLDPEERIRLWRILTELALNCLFFS